jgi:hypothetical protein
MKEVSTKLHVALGWVWLLAVLAAAIADAGAPRRLRRTYTERSIKYSERNQNFPATACLLACVAFISSKLHHLHTIQFYHIIASIKLCCGK